MKRKNKKGYAQVGSQRAARLMAEEQCRVRPRMVEAVRPKDMTGLKVWRIVNLAGFEVLTPWANKEKARRRRVGKAAKQARKVAWRR
jgi:hypothetical protein